MKASQKLMGFWYIALGLIFLGATFFLFINQETSASKTNLLLLSALVGLLFILLGLTRLRSTKDKSNNLKSAFLKIEKAIDSLSIRIANWPFFRNPKAMDWLAIILFVLFASLFTLGRWNGNSPFIFVYDDGGTIGSMAAAYDHPGSFAGDIIIGDTLYTTSYKSIFIDLIRLLTRVTHDYGLTFIVLLPIFIMLQAIGVYLFGKKVLANRFLAFFLAIFSFTPIYATNWDYWGITTDVLTRQLFQCLVIYVFILAFSWRDQPKRWPWILLLLGLLTYIYPVSSIPIAFAVWLGLILFFPRNIPAKSKFIISLGVGFVYLIAILPVLFFFRGGTFSSAFGNDPQALQTLYQVYSDLLNMGNILSILLKSLTWSGALPLAVLGAIILLRSGNKSDKNKLSLFAAWILGVSFISLFVVGIEHFIELKLGIVPLQTEMVRGIRYLPFFLEMIIFLSLAFVYQKADKTLNPNVIKLLVVLFVIVYTLGLRSNILKDIDYPRNEIACLFTGNLTCQTKAEKDAIDLFVNAKNILPPHTRVLSIPPTTYPYESAVRYYLLQPSGLSYSDINRIIVIDPFTTQTLIDLQNRINEEVEALPLDDRLQVYLDHANELRTDVFIIALADFGGAIPENVPVLYQNDTFALISTHPGQ